MGLPMAYGTGLEHPCPFNNPPRHRDQFAGCVVVISHDRWFLDRIATHILTFEGDSKVTFFDGNFSEYEGWRRQTLGDAATRPHRITYRKLTR
jgi:sulfate-transporting ATPase